MAADHHDGLHRHGMESLYEFPYPSESVAAAHPFKPLHHRLRPVEEMRQRASAHLEFMSSRRSVRMMSDRPVPADLIATAVSTAGTAPSGANLQPWHFVAVSDPVVKRSIREAAEAEERTNYVNGRMNEEWQQALAQLGTDWHKEFLEIAPWIVVMFEQRHRYDANGKILHNYYVKESCGIAAGFFISAIHNMGLVTLTHTPTPMAFLSKLLGRPDNERASIVFPVGYPVDGTMVPDIERKGLDEILTIEPPVNPPG